MSLMVGQLWEGRHNQKRRVIGFEVIRGRRYIHWEPVDYSPPASSIYRFILVGSFRSWATRLLEGSVAGMAKERRITIDLTTPATKEYVRRCQPGFRNDPINFRHSFSLFRIYLKAKDDGHEMRIVNPADLSVQTRIEIPVK